MATDDVQVLVTGTAPAPTHFTIPGNGQITPRTVFATYDGTAAAGSFKPALKIISDAGATVGIYAADSAVAAGASADVSWFPGVTAAATSGALPIIGFEAFTPAGNQLQITSTNPAVPTSIVTSPSIAFDGSTTVEIQFYASAIDLDQRTFTGQASVLLELYRDSTALGIIADYNADPGLYFVTTCFCAAFDTPAAGSHTYSIQGFLQVSAGTGPGNSFVYGSGIATPHTTRPGFLLLLNATTEMRRL